ncbi:hypothetical protein Q1695_004808 [Nippostrongylus brasiliensis]|nr:hypothetical protein Q1695_004808 [Nippostrongylus brasiliensis]
MKQCSRSVVTVIEGVETVDGPRVLIGSKKSTRNSRSFFCRSSLFHTPSSASEELDDNVLINGDVHFENDSGIDSLRQDCSSCTDKGDVGKNGETIRRKGGRGRTHVVQRRKSLGAMVDPTELEQICLGNDLFWLSTEECGTDIISSSAEMDTCLRYHLLRVHSCLQVLEACDVQSPFSFKATEMLKKLGSEEVSLEQLLQISTDAPLMPNILKVMSEFDVDPSLQEIWMSTCSPLNAQLVVPSDDLRTQIKLNIAHIVEQHYPHLVNRVADSIMRLLLDCAQDDPKIVTLFHFVGVFRGRSFVPFVENLGHDAWMISLLSSGQASRVLQVADRLCRVPVVPPLESLKHIAMTLADSKNENRVILEKYLFSARGLLLDDLHSSFLYLLEAEEEIVRIGAIRALSALQNSQLHVNHLSYIAKHDDYVKVRREAVQFLRTCGIKWPSSDDEQITRI